MECLPQRHGGTQRVDLEYTENSVLLSASAVLFWVYAKKDRSAKVPNEFERNAIHNDPNN